MSDQKLWCFNCKTEHIYCRPPIDETDLEVCRIEKDLLEDFKKIDEECKETDRKCQEQLNGLLKKYWNKREMKQVVYDTIKSKA